MSAQDPFGGLGFTVRGRELSFGDPSDAVTIDVERQERGLRGRDVCSRRLAVTDPEARQRGACAQLGDLAPVPEPLRDVGAVLEHVPRAGGVPRHQ